MRGLPEQYEVTLEQDFFALRWRESEDADSLEEFRITSKLALDDRSAHLGFDVYPFVRKPLPENFIYEVRVKYPASKESRIGWFIPANALDSVSHDYAENEHFLRYAFVGMRAVLADRPDLFQDALRDLLDRGDTEAGFSDLFQDNLGFLVVCKDRILPEYKFDIMQLWPSLVALGCVPLEQCDPETVDWVAGSPDLDGSVVVLRPMNPDRRRPDLPARLVAVAAASHFSKIVQFFYLYQVVELLMEDILRARLTGVGTKISESIATGQLTTTRDLLEGLGSKLSEMSRLAALVDTLEKKESLKDLVESSNRFLVAVGEPEKDGIAALYKVRNFVVHQVRNMPEESSELLAEVVREFAMFLPWLLHSFAGQTEGDP